MAADSRRYAKLLKAQTLVKARDEADLEESRSQRQLLSEEDEYLFSLMENGSEIDFFDPNLLARRLQRNAKREAVLDAQILKQRQTLLEASRRCDVLDEKRKYAREAEDRKEMADMLEEYVAAKIAKDSSLG
ncbi:hypothetical protein [Bartonella sp. LJL80]